MTAARKLAAAPAPPDEFLTEPELAALLKVSPGKLRADRAAGTAPPWHKLGQLVRYRRADVDAWLEQQRAATP